MTARTPAGSFGSINLTKLSWSNSPPRKPLMTNLNPCSIMLKAYCGNWNFPIGLLSCAPGTWDFQPQKPMISKSGCRLRGFTAKFHPAAILKIFRPDAAISALRKKEKKAPSLFIRSTVPGWQWVGAWRPSSKIASSPMAVSLSLMRCNPIWGDWKK